MNGFKIWLLFYILFLAYQTASSQVTVFDADSIPSQIPENLDIYLAIGQSNMAGRALISAEAKPSLEKGYLFTGDLVIPWVVATNPLNRYSTVRKNISMQRMGPVYSFAESMTAARSDSEIGMVVNAKGGTKLVQWMPGTKLYQEAIAQTHKALKYGKLKGVIWHQGEGDCDSIRVSLYLGRLEILIHAIREEFNDPNIPFVVGQLFENEKRHAFNEMILQLPDFIRHTAVVSSEGTQAFDGTHYDSESTKILGTRYAHKMKILQEKVE